MHYLRVRVLQYMCIHVCVFHFSMTDISLSGVGAVIAGVVGLMLASSGCYYCILLM